MCISYRDDAKFHEFSIEKGTNVISDINGSFQHHLDSSQFYISIDY